MKRNFSSINPIVAVNDSDSVQIDCIVTGFPKPWIEWISLAETHEAHLHTDLPGEQHEMRLVLDNVTRDDAGAYVCKATNGFEEVERNIALVVQCE